jgi:UDP-galactopyranose mutase
MYLFAFLSQFGKAKQLNNITTSAYRIHKGGVYSLLSDIQKTEGAIETREKIMESFIEEQKVKIKMLQNIKAIEITLLYKLLINKKVRHYFIYLRKLKYNNPFNAVIKSTLLVFKKLLNKMLLCL